MRMVFNGQDVYDKNHEIQSIKNTIGTGTLDTEAQALIPAVNELNASLVNLIKFKNLSHNYTVAGNGFVNWNPTGDTGYTETGYTPVGIVGYQSNNTSVVPINLMATDSAWGCAIRNVSSSSVTNIFVYTMMYVKDFS